MEITYTINGIAYKTSGYYGSQISSRENWLYLGDTRVIMGQLFYIASIERHFFTKNIVRWRLLDNSVESIESFLRGLSHG